MAGAVAEDCSDGDGNAEVISTPRNAPALAKSPSQEAKPPPLALRTLDPPSRRANADARASNKLFMADEGSRKGATGSRGEIGMFELFFFFF